MTDALEQIIIKSWTLNAKPWVKAIRGGLIESRVRATNKALLEAICARSPKKVLDLGCGEGWLARELTPRGVDVLGIDVVEELCESAQASGAGRYQCLNYADVSLSSINESFDVVVANFSLLGKETVEQMLQKLPNLLGDQGALIVQTLHPETCSETEPYQDGWRMGSWDGFRGNFAVAAPWFFRTRESWESLLESSGFGQLEIIEPTYFGASSPVSIIFVAEE